MMSVGEANNMTSDADNGTQVAKMDVSPLVPVVTSLITHYHQQLAAIEAKLKELLKNQQVLIDGLKGENERFKETETSFNLRSLFNEISVYTQKLVKLKKEMNTVSDKTSNLKRRALRLEQLQQQKALDQEQQVNKQAQREKHLIAKPAWTSGND